MYIYMYSICYFGSITEYFLPRENYTKRNKFLFMKTQNILKTSREIRSDDAKKT